MAQWHPDGGDNYYAARHPLSAAFQYEVAVSASSPAVAFFSDGELDMRHTP